MLIGLDHPYLYAALEEVIGKYDEPIGWTCVGKVYEKIEKNENNFSRSYFCKKQSELDSIKSDITKFWQIEQNLENSDQLSPLDKEIVN